MRHLSQAPLWVLIASDNVVGAVNKNVVIAEINTINNVNCNITERVPIQLLLKNFYVKAHQTVVGIASEKRKCNAHEVVFHLAVALCARRVWLTGHLPNQAVFTLP